MIYNRSAHPVEIKKISIRLWSLRDEIEAAIGRRIKECEAAGVPLYIDDIKRFYNLDLDSPLTDQSNVIPLHGKTAKDDGLASLMETLGEEAKTEEVKAAAVEVAPVPEAAPVIEAAADDPATEEVKPQEPPKTEGEALEAKPENEVLATTPSAEAQTPVEVVAVVPEESKTFKEAEEIMAVQTLQGLETKKPNPILERPYQRQAPDLDRISYGFTLLSDINMDNILSFTKNGFLQGQSVVLEFLIPKSFMMTADVLYCSHYAMKSRIISSTKPDFRLQCRFSFSVPGERDTLRSFLKSIEPTVAKTKVKKEAKKVEDDLGI